MVLADLGRKLNAALSSLNRAPVVDEKVIALRDELAEHHLIGPYRSSTPS